VPPTIQSQHVAKEVGTARASSGTAMRDAHTSFCCFLLPGQAAF